MYYANPYQPYGARTPAYNQYQPPVHGIVSVNGRAGAEAYYLPPNSDALLADENSDTVFIKKTFIDMYK